jgi:hypothetical protein
LCLDRGYDAPAMHELASQHSFTPHIRTRGEQIKLKLRTPGWRARRWAVDSSHSWLNRNRGLLIRWCNRKTRTTSHSYNSPVASSHSRKPTPPDSPPPNRDRS